VLRIAVGGGMRIAVSSTSIFVYFTIIHVMVIQIVVRLKIIELIVKRMRDVW
jgi:hypothetical protein